jgi:hypothetical protein
MTKIILQRLSQGEIIAVNDKNKLKELETLNKHVSITLIVI